MITKILESLGLVSVDTITQLVNEEDSSNYQVWKIDTAGERYILKRAKGMELQVYRQYLAQSFSAVPKLYGITCYDGDDYLLMEYIPGRNLNHANLHGIKAALDGLISLQAAFLNASDPLKTYEASLQSRQKRRNYLLDPQLEQAYDAYLSAYQSMPRTLCHDDLLPFNVIVGKNSASLIDWEYAGILPYPVSIARLLAHTEEDENAFFYMSNDDKAFAIQYYYDNFVAKHNISYEEYIHTLNMFLLYEYCEWIMLGNKYPDADMERAKIYVQKAKKHLNNIQQEK